MRAAKILLPEIWFALAATLLGGAPVAAQHRFTFSVDGGLAAARGEGSTFRERSLRGPYFAASINGKLTRRFEIFGKFESISFGPRTGQSTACLISDNPCVLPFPEMHGWRYVIGPGFRPNRYVETRLGIGIGRHYASNDVWLRPATTTIAGDIAVFPINHVGVAANFGYVDLPRYAGADLSLKSFDSSVRLR